MTCMLLDGLLAGLLLELLDYDLVVLASCTLLLDDRYTGR